MSGPRIAVVLKGYPRLSETFIAQEILALEKRGLSLDIWSLRRPTDRFRHPRRRQRPGLAVDVAEALEGDDR